MGGDISLGLLGLDSDKSSVDALRRQREGLLGRLQNPANSNDSQKDRQGVIVELAALDRSILQAEYHEETVRLENKRLKNEEYAARTIKERNRVRREREKLLFAESMHKLSEANNKLDEQTGNGGLTNDQADSISGDLKEARELSAEAAQVVQRRKNDEWKEYAEEKARKRKKVSVVNLQV